MENSFKDEVIVLKNTKVGDYDLSITVFFKKYGKENIYIPKGQLLKNFTLTTTQPFNWFKGVFLKRKNKIFIKEIDTFQNLALPIARDLEKFYTGFFILDVFNRFVEKEYRDEKIFILLKKTVYYLQKEKNLKNFKINFLAKFIKLSGVYPMLDKCVKCGEKIGQYNFYTVSVEEGGSICKRCSKGKRKILSFKDVKYLEILKKVPFSRLNDFNVKNKEKLEKFLLDYAEHHIVK